MDGQIDARTGILIVSSLLAVQLAASFGAITLISISSKMDSNVIKNLLIALLPTCIAALIGYLLPVPVIGAAIGVLVAAALIHLLTDKDFYPDGVITSFLMFGIAMFATFACARPIYEHFGVVGTR